MRFLPATCILTAILLSTCPALAEPPRRAADLWSLRPRRQPTVPQFHEPADRTWVRTGIDAFILVRLRREGLRPAAEADRTTLIRRVTFDLTGLPPTPAEVAAFAGDPAPDAYERLVERLLASPHYGERWGRHWLDVVRYAETEGFEYDRYRPGAWRFRDYVIGAFNQDRPFDRFIVEQLAGDALDPDNREMQVAVGFHRLGPVRRNAGNADVASSRNEVLTEMTDAIGSAFLGLTVGCARCHDHKFDPISLTDYYRLQAFLSGTQENDISLAPADVTAEWKARSERIKAEIQKLQTAVQGLEGEAKQRMQEKVREAQRSLPPALPTISSVRDAAEGAVIHVLKRGDPDRKGPVAEPGIPDVFSARADTTRLGLARWLTAADNPLTARVLANRVWQYHFGRGLVATANDFGANGSPPTHPELLDFLANDLVTSGWQLKPLHRCILLSSTYRQVSTATQSAAVDPDNRWLSRFSRRRLDAEEIRDSMLTIAGRLNRHAGGPSVVLPVEPELVQLLYDPKQWDVTADPAQHDRRSVYLIAKRNLRLPFTEVFDQPDAQTSCPRREQSTHAPQALELLNGKTANRLAAALAQRLEREAGPDRARQVELAFQLAAGRGPTEGEKALALRFLEKQPLREFALAMFNLNAFLYVQ